MACPHDNAYYACFVFVFFFFIFKKQRQLLNLPAKDTQELSFTARNKLGEEIHNNDDPEEVSIDALDLDPTDEFDTAIKMFAVDESFRKDFREHAVCLDASCESRATCQM